MGADLCREFASAREIFEAADDCLGFNLRRICFEGPAEQLNDDLISQLAVYTYSCALIAVMGPERLGTGVLSGYSSGFYAAAHAAGCFDFVAGLELVRKAGGLLLNAAAEDPGAMGVVFGLSAEAVEAICTRIGPVQPAIFNTPRQTVVSGSIEAVTTALAQAVAQGALDAYRLPAAAAYHSTGMRPAARALATVLADTPLRAPRTLLISYSTLQAVPDGGALARLLAMQLYSPVRWVELIHLLHRRGIRRVVEVGPGQMLSRTVRWIARGLTAHPLPRAAAVNAYLRQAPGREANRA